MSEKYKDLLTLMAEGDPREIKRAYAVRTCLLGFSRSDSAKICDVSVQFVDKWKAIYLESGAEGLKLAYKGSQGYLTSAQKEEIIEWIKVHETMTIKNLKAHIKDKYNVFYHSDASYTQLLEQANLSYKKSRKRA